jgi:hypothetical protein
VRSYLAEGELLEKGLGLVGLTKDEILRHLDLGPGELSRDQYLVGSEVLRICIKCLEEKAK